MHIFRVFFAAIFLVIFTDSGNASTPFTKLAMDREFEDEAFSPHAQWINIILESVKQEKKESVDLTGKKLRSLPPALLSLSFLVEVDLTSNNLFAFPTDLSRIPSLKRLILYMNRIPSIPDDIAHFTNLECLDLGENATAEISSQIGRLTLLRKLDLSWPNESTPPRDPTFPEAISNLTQLETLSLARRGLKSLPAGIGQLKRLTSFFVGQNCLRSLPDELCLLENLRDLYIEKNNIKEWPSKFSYLTALKNLAAYKTGTLISFPRGFENNVHLILINFSDLHIEAIPSSIDSLFNLESLILSRNRIKQVPPSICKCKKLEKLYLDSNPLRVIAETFVEKIRALGQNPEDFGIEKEDIATLIALQVLIKFNNVYVDLRHTDVDNYLLFGTGKNEKTSPHF